MNISRGDDDRVQGLMWRWVAGPEAAAAPLSEYPLARKSLTSVQHTHTWAVRRAHALRPRLTCEASLEGHKGADARLATVHEMTQLL